MSVLDELSSLMKYYCGLTVDQMDAQRRMQSLYHCSHGSAVFNATKAFCFSSLRFIFFLLEY